MDPAHLALAALLLIVLAATWTRRPGRSLLDLFGAGFVPYRADTGWPRGVQEEEPQRWGSRPIRPRDDARPPSVPVEDVGRATVRRR